MFFYAVLSQSKLLLKQRNSILVFYSLLAIMLLNFTTNVVEFQGLDITQMIQPMKLLTISYNRVYNNSNITLILVQLYPILVVFPAGLSLRNDQQFGIDILVEARLSRLKYRYTKMISVFTVTFIIFTVPFLFEIILNCLAFPIEANGDLTQLNIYDPDYVQLVNNFLWLDLYLYSPYLYATVGTLIFGLLSGVLAIFAMAFSSLCKVKFKIVLFLPVFLLLNATLYLSDLFDIHTTSIKWYDYFLLFNGEMKSKSLLVFVMLSILICSTFAIYISSRLDEKS